MFHLICSVTCSSSVALMVNTSRGGLQANLSVRYVPNQTAEDLVGHLRRHLHHEFRKLRSFTTVHINVSSHGQHWSADLHGKFFKQASAAIEAEWGEAPLAVREGGTMPCASMLESLLRAPAIMIPIGQHSDNCHLANERIHRQNLTKGKNVMRRIIESMTGSALEGPPAATAAVK
jgi:acetylornithine deacetylase/succinyl-diaminopimelate desuccinylase-like protein